MNRDEVLDYCSSFHGAVEDYPFGEHASVWKYRDKIFALVAFGREPPQVNLKCDPEYAVTLREAHPDVIVPGWHMNKRHWNTVLHEKLDDELVRELIAHSYDLIEKKR